MRKPLHEGGVRARVPPRLSELRADLTALRLLLEHIGERKVIGTTELTRLDVPREAHLLTLEDGEHLVLLVLDDTLCHWDATREPLEQLYQRACHWLTEPPASNERCRAAGARAQGRQESAAVARRAAAVAKPREASSLADEKGGDACGADHL